MDQRLDVTGAHRLGAQLAQLGPEARVAGDVDIWRYGSHCRSRGGMDGSGTDVYCETAMGGTDGEAITEGRCWDGAKEKREEERRREEGKEKEREGQSVGDGLCI